MKIFLIFWCLLLNTTSQVCGLLQFPTFEDEVLAEFKTSVQDLISDDYMKSDGYLRRWLNVHDFDLEAALEQFKKSFEWRKKHNMKSILHEDFRRIDEAYPHVIDGLDKDGRPIVWIPVGSYDARKIALSGELQLYHRYLMRALELMEIHLHKMRQTSGLDNFTQVVGVFDLGGFNVKQGACYPCLEIIPELVSNIELNYPNIFHLIYHINTPGLFQSVLKISTNFMSPRTKEAVQIFDYDKAKWSAALLEQIPADQLPIQYGGSKVFDFHLSAIARTQFVAEIIAAQKVNYTTANHTHHQHYIQVRPKETPTRTVEENHQSANTGQRTISYPHPFFANLYIFAIAQAYFITTPN